jgi:hypothetical protein
MLTEELRTQLRTRPFRPFTIHLSDAREISVMHQDYAWLLQNGSMLFVEDKAGKVHHISTIHITHLTSDASAAVAA